MSLVITRGFGDCPTNPDAPVIYSNFEVEIPGDIVCVISDAIEVEVEQTISQQIEIHGGIEVEIREDIEVEECDG